MQDVKERRIYKRLDVNLDGSFSKLNFLGTSGGGTQATVTNLSASGLFVETDKGLSEGALVEINFFLMGGKNHVHAEGLVRWNKRNCGRSGMGIEFLAHN